MLVICLFALRFIPWMNFSSKTYFAGTLNNALLTRFSSQKVTAGDWRRGARKKTEFLPLSNSQQWPVSWGCSVVQAPTGKAVSLPLRVSPAPLLPPTGGMVAGGDAANLSCVSITKFTFQLLQDLWMLSPCYTSSVGLAGLDFLFLTHTDAGFWPQEDTDLPSICGNTLGTTLIVSDTLPRDIISNSPPLPLVRAKWSD